MSEERSNELKSLPPGWCWASIGQCCELVQYGSSAKTGDDAQGVPVLRMGNIRGDGYLDTGRLKYLPAGHSEFPDLLLRPDDLLFNRTNSAELVGKTAVYRGVPSPCSFASYLIRVRLSSSVLPTLVAESLNSAHGRRWIGSVVNQTVGQANVNGTKLVAFQFPLPPLPEQGRLMDALDELFSDLDAAVAALARVRAKLKLYRASVLKAAVEGALTAEWRAQHPTAESASELLARILAERRRLWEDAQIAKFKAKGQEPPKNWKAKYKEPVASDGVDLPALPEGWLWATVEQLSTKVADGVHKKPTYVSSGIPFITVRNLTAGPGISFDRLRFVTLADHHDFIKRADPKRGDLLLSKDGTLGVVRLVDTDVAFSLFVSVALIQPVMPEMQHFLGVALASPQVQAQMVPKGSGLVHIHLEDLRRDCIPVLPLAEQEAIVELVEDQMSVIDHLEADIESKLKSAQALRQAILRHAFSGKLVPQDPNDEPASELLKRIAAEREARVRGADSVNGKKPSRAARGKRA